MNPFLRDYRNSGFDNTGSLNSGDGNSGDYNIGSYNAGHKNYGCYNSGDFNIGASNAGDWNSADGCGGVFCTVQPDIYIFDKPSGITLEGWRTSKACRILSRVRTAVWVPRPHMSLQERLAHPEYKRNGGYLKTRTLKEACCELWPELSDEEKAEVYAIPNFNADIFYDITGIRSGS